MIESLGSILGSSDGDYLQRIFLSTKLQEFLKKEHRQPVKVVVKNGVVTLSCQSQAQAAFWRLRLRRLYGEINNVLGPHNYKIRVRVKA